MVRTCLSAASRNNNSPLLIHTIFLVTPTSYAPADVTISPFIYICSCTYDNPKLLRAGNPVILQVICGNQHTLMLQHNAELGQQMRDVCNKHTFRRPQTQFLTVSAAAVHTNSDSAVDGAATPNFSATASVNRRSVLLGASTIATGLLFGSGSSSASVKLTINRKPQPKQYKLKAGYTVTVPDNWALAYVSDEEVYKSTNPPCVRPQGGS